MSEGMAAPAGLISQLRKFEANARWAVDHEERLLPHKGAYVAIDDQKLLGVAKTAQELREKYKDRPTVFITFVSPPELAWLL